MAKTGCNRWLKGCEAVASEAEEARAGGVVGNNSAGRSRRWPCGLGWGPWAMPADDRVPGTMQVRWNKTETGEAGAGLGPAVLPVAVFPRDNSGE